MSYQQLQLVCDSSTVTNFKAWGSAISSWMSTIGWTQTADTGQVNWSTISAVPGNNVYVYEVWKSNDGISPAFYLKIEYGNGGPTNNGANAPTLALTLGTGTNGAGQVTGGTTRLFTAYAPGAAPSATNQYECDFYGTNGSLAIMMWRTTGTVNSNQQIFAVERSINATGSYTTAHVTLWTGGAGAASEGVFNQQTLHFTLGVAPLYGGASYTQQGGWAVRRGRPPNGVTSAFDNGIPIDMCTPSIGFFDYPCTVVGAMCGQDVTGGAQFQVTNQYGAVATYIASADGCFDTEYYGGAVGFAICMRVG